MEIVNVTAWRRPDFLLACLERLARADAPHLHYRLNVDHGRDPDVDTAAKTFAAKVGADRVEVAHRGPCRDQGPTRNMLQALHESMAYGADLIHLVEDDVFVSLGYFAYHRSAHELAPDAFCVTACRPLRFGAPASGDRPERAVLRPYATTVGTSFRPDRLAEILTFLPMSYTEDRVGHIRRTFPDHPCAPHEWSGVDGALGRVRHRLGLSTVYPEVGRAYHAGFIGDGCRDAACGHDTTRDGYGNGPHRHGTGLTGTLEERAAQLLNMRAEDFNARAEIPDHVWFDPEVDYGPVTGIATSR